MSLTITIPEEVACILGAEPQERDQRARESIALELYREGKITLRTMGKLAGLGEDYWAADAFRVRYGLAMNIEEEDPRVDQTAIETLLRS